MDVLRRWECGRCGAEVRKGKTKHFCGEGYPLKATTDIRLVRYVRATDNQRGAVDQSERDHYAPGSLADMTAQRDFWRRVYGELEAEVKAEREARNARGAVGDE
jgi:hypothetical protein